MNLRASIAVVALLAALATASGAGSAMAAQCTFTGPTWSEAGQTGTTYNLDTQGVSCGFATPWARKLAGRPNAKPFYPVKGGPAGWVCNSQVTRAAKIIVGACVKTTKRFGWSAAAT